MIEVRRNMELNFREFRREDFSEYQNWFSDKQLNKALGPMEVDDVWLKSVLNQTDGIEYTVFEKEDLIAVIGIKIPTTEHPAYCITDFAIKPGLTRHGIGSEILARLIKLHDKNNPLWKTFIDVKNRPAQSFFLKNGWICKSVHPDESEMLEFTSSQSASAHR